MRSDTSATSAKWPARMMLTTTMSGYSLSATIAWSDAAASRIIDFSFVPFATEGRPAAACEKIVLDGPGCEKWQRHQNYAGHILSEEWQKQPNGTYRWVPESSRPGHLRSQKANHYLDATACAIAARTNWGLWTIRPKQGPLTKPAKKPPRRDREPPSETSWIHRR